MPRLVRLGFRRRLGVTIRPRRQGSLHDRGWLTKKRACRRHTRAAQTRTTGSHNGDRIAGEIGPPESQIGLHSKLPLSAHKARCHAFSGDNGSAMLFDWRTGTRSNP
jgi:hypothetical protein